MAADRREQELADSEARFRALAESIAAAVVVFRDDDTIVFANAGAQRIYGYAPDEIVGRPFADLIPPDQREAHRARVQRFLATGERRLRWEGVELSGLRKDGSVAPLEVTIGAFVRGGARYFVGIAQDITARKELERQRDELLGRERAEKERAEAAVRTRDEVLAIVSHELRNPLNTIALTTDALQSGDIPSTEVPRTLDLVRQAVGRMNRLIGDLLDVARLEAGQRLTLQTGTLDLGGVVQETCDGLTAEADGKRQRLVRRVEEGLPRVEGDRHRLVQALSNLVGNALKFTGEGGRVDVAARREGGEAVIEVSDTGPGMSPETLANVFTPYWQARHTARLGTGLGLAIAKGIVEAHGGRIWASSTPGVGSTFAFALPVKDQGAAGTV